MTVAVFQYLLPMGQRVGTSEKGAASYLLSFVTRVSARWICQRLGPSTQTDSHRSLVRCSKYKSTEWLTGECLDVLVPRLEKLSAGGKPVEMLKECKLLAMDVMVRATLLNLCDSLR